MNTQPADRLYMEHFQKRPERAQCDRPLLLNADRAKLAAITFIHLGFFESRSADRRGKIKCRAALAQLPGGVRMPAFRVYHNGTWGHWQQHYGYYVHYPQERRNVFAAPLPCA